MRLPLALLTFAVALAPAPATAQQAAQGDLAALAEQLQDPFTQAQYAEIGAALVAVALQLPLAPLAEAAAQLPGGEALPSVDPDARVADLVGPRGERAPTVVQRELPRVMQAAGSMADSLDGTLDVMQPQLRAMTERLSRNFPPPR